MTIGAVLFLLSSWSLVLGLAGWSYFRILVASSPGDGIADVGPGRERSRRS